MIGVFGIAGNEDVLYRNRREESFNLISNSISIDSFYNKSICGKN